jgi:hypothetical protein
MKRRTLVEIEVIEAGTTTSGIATFTIPLITKPLKRDDIFRINKKSQLIKEIDAFLFSGVPHGKK